jgi:peptidoglycan/LPS O-acetylase OafA/YrhL
VTIGARQDHSEEVAARKGTGPGLDGADRRRAATMTGPDRASEAGPFRLGHRPPLDGLRGVAILAVLVFHGEPFKYGRGGFLGVDVFFVLSGFLITCLLAQEWRETQRIDLRAFYARRMLRLYPALLAVVFLGWPLFAWRQSSDEGPSRYLASVAPVLLYLTNYRWTEIPDFLGPTWSLALEEQFYLVWPVGFLLMLRARLGPRAIVAVVAVAIGAVAIHRARLFSAWPGPLTAKVWERLHGRVYSRPDCRLDSPLVGCLTALLVCWCGAPRVGRWIVLGPVIFVFFALLLTPYYGPWQFHGGFTLVALGVGLILLHVVQDPSGPLARLLSIGPLTCVGRVSYSLYLWHMAIYRLYDYLVPDPPSVRSYLVRLFLPFFIKVAGSMGAATLSCHLVEHPFLRLKARFAIVRERPAVAG